MVSSAIWAQLATPGLAAGCIPYVFTDNATIVVDSQNFVWDQALFRLLVANGLTVNLVDKSAVPGANTVARNMGRCAVAAGASSVVITNTMAVIGDVVLAQLESTDATLTFIKAAKVTSAGVITITGNSNATAAATLVWFLLKANVVAA